ncbi:hypothetical protein AAMO2058_000124900 [Amorphochlora amoebiformis]
MGLFWMGCLLAMSSGTEFRAPIFKWAQTRQFIHITVMIKTSSPDDVSILLNNHNGRGKLFLETTVEDKTAQLNLEFLLEIDREISSYKVQGHFVNFKISKKEPGFWSRLLYTKTRPSNMKIDFKKWIEPPESEGYIDGGDPDEEEEEKESTRRKKKKKKKRKKSARKVKNRSLKSNGYSREVWRRIEDFANKLQDSFSSFHTLPWGTKVAYAYLIGVGGAMVVTLLGLCAWDSLQGWREEKMVSGRDKQD